MDFTQTKLTSEETYTMTDNELAKFTNLTSLDLSYNSSISDEGIKNLKSLTHLDISYQRKITNEGIKELSNLQELNLMCNTIIGFDVLDSLPKLNIIYVKYDQPIYQMVAGKYDVRLRT